MNKIVMFALVTLFSGCASKDVVVKTEFKDVYIPVKCEVKLPPKPKYNPLNLQSVKDIAKYYEIVELELKRCVNE